MVDVSLPQHAKRFGFLAPFWVIGDIIGGSETRRWNPGSFGFLGFPFLVMVPLSIGGVQLIERGPANPVF